MNNQPNSVLCPFCHHLSKVYWPTQSVWQCVECKLLFRYPLPNSEEIEGYYREGWATSFDNPEIVGGTTKQLAQEYANLMLQRLNYTNFKNLKILEFGAGKGIMMQTLVDLGAVVYGVDPFSFRYLQGQGFPAFASLNEVPDETFDGIITIQVVEHLREPWSTLTTLRKKLVSKGWIYISTINAQSVSAYHKGSKWREVINPTHFYFYNKDSIESILYSAGYSSFEQLKSLITYPHHSLLRQQFSRIVQRLSLGGELSYLAWK